MRSARDPVALCGAVMVGWVLSLSGCGAKPDEAGVAARVEDEHSERDEAAQDGSASAEDPDAPSATPLFPAPVEPLPETAGEEGSDPIAGSFEPATALPPQAEPSATVGPRLKPPAIEPRVAETHAAKPKAARPKLAWPPDAVPAPSGGPTPQPEMAGEPRMPEISAMPVPPAAAPPPPEAAPEPGAPAAAAEPAAAVPKTLPLVAESAGSGGASQPLTERASDDGKFHIVKVYYGTDRAAAGTSEAGGRRAVGFHWLTAAAGGITFLLLIVACCFSRGRLVQALVALGVLVTVGLGAWTAYLRTQTASEHIQAHRIYGNGRGKLEMGTCEVSIPKDHRIGELEAPSVLRLEFNEDPERHVSLLEVHVQPAEEFFADLADCVARSEKKEAFVFVHGYNVSFENAARRTAQLAHDLKFDGAPVFFSWPSAGSLLRYAVDETNVAWAVPHLKQFLLDVARQSGAQHVHLIAHSMGNRALTSALVQLSYELREDARLFHEVILTAPDIDAEIFRRDIVPAIVNTAGRVTLYASSNDEALAASKQFHGYPRAGESGENLVVIPGIDTVDVSAIDTSFLGHSYYGDNDTVLADLFELLREAKPPQSRSGLHLMRLGQLRYWVFLRERLGLSPAGAAMP